MSLQTFFVQFAFLYAPLLHCEMEQVTPQIYRGPDPRAATLQCLHDKGVKTIISLRTNPETKKQKLCESMGMKWINIKTGVFQTPTPDQFDEFRQIVNDPKNLPCYVSCEIDMDRTGIYLAAYRAVDQHWSIQQALDELNSHHPKRWWPVFRKYGRVVTAYAKSHTADSEQFARDSAGNETPLLSQTNVQSRSEAADPVKTPTNLELKTSVTGSAAGHNVGVAESH